MFKKLKKSLNSWDETLQIFKELNEDLKKQNELLKKMMDHDKNNK